MRMLIKSFFSFYKILLLYRDSRALVSKFTLQNSVTTRAILGIVIPAFIIVSFTKL